MTGPAAGSPSTFEEYCALHGIQPHEYGTAFATWLNEISGGEWDGEVEGPVQ
jgi:hypothetical protein